MFSEFMKFLNLEPHSIWSSVFHITSDQRNENVQCQITAFIVSLFGQIQCMCLTFKLTSDRKVL